jgi:hypothetical protein
MSIRYSDTTVKLEASVVQEAAAVLPENQTFTAFVREAVWRDVRRRKMRKAAALYMEALAHDAEEAGAMREWEAAPLATEPKKRRARKP